MKPDKQGDQGFAFISVLIFTVLLFGLSLSYFDLMMSEKRLTKSSENSLKAEALAEAGLDEVFWEYNYGDSDFTGWTVVSATQRRMTATLTNDLGAAVGGYVTDVTNFTSNTPAVTVTGTLTAGTTGGGTTSVVQAQLQGRPLFSAAVAAKGAITMSGNAATDSYDSILGAYGGANLFQNGDVVTNMTGSPAITLSGNAEIGGDAGTAGGSISMSGNADVTGSQSTNSGTAIFDVEAAPSLTSYPSLSLAGNSSQALTSGSYPNISLSGNANLTVASNVTIHLTSTTTAFSNSGNGRITIASGGSLTIYSDGDISISGNGVVNNNSGQLAPLMFQIKGSSTCDSVSLSGNGDITGLINTPYAAVTNTGNGEVYGGVICNTYVSAGNGKVHYDQQLGSGGPTAGAQLTWTRRV